MVDYNNLFNLNGKTALITGSNGQLGQVFASAFLSQGAQVIGIDIQELSFNKDLLYYQCNITKESEIELAFEKIQKNKKCIDILINNAGVSTFKNFQSRTEEEFDFVMDVNLKGVFFCTRNFVKYFGENGKGKSIINIGSVYGIISPDPRIYTDCGRNSPEIYGATKAGVVQMTKYFAVHLANRGIRVNSICPGGIFNPNAPQGEDFQKNYSYRCPMGRMADAEEIAGAAIYLASDCASYTNGTNIVIDGGFSCW